MVVEWWRGQRGPVAKLIDDFVVEPLSYDLARLSGEALARCAKGPSATDAVVMASAASRGDVVYTGDLYDLQRLQRFFPGVRVLAV